MEWKLQGNYQSTFEFHEHRPRANHLIEQQHNQRLRMAARMIANLQPRSVVDLGCGDGGLLKLLNGYAITAWGYDFCPGNVEGAVNAKDRGLDVQLIDVFNTRTVPEWGQVAVMTEVLEHLADPHDVLAWVSENVEYVLVSSPHGERPDSFDECHIWAWDIPGYAEMVSEHFEVLQHETADWSQLIVGRSKYEG
jgi:2-polyprenyl-3-methyl-5-hydroxy-6-metoxy-1,4-benzoquinol methylase